MPIFIAPTASKHTFAIRVHYPVTRQAVVVPHLFLSYSQAAAYASNAYPEHDLVDTPFALRDAIELVHHCIREMLPAYGDLSVMVARTLLLHVEEYLIAQWAEYDTAEDEENAYGL